MTRIDILNQICDLTDVNPNDSTIRPKILRYIDRAYIECLRREYKAPPIAALTDSTVLLTDDRNAPFMAYHGAWQHFINEQDTAMAGIFKDEYEGFRIYKAAKTPIKTIDVYGVGDLTNVIVGVSQYE